jgi:hypothetical protein
VAGADSDSAGWNVGNPPVPFEPPGQFGSRPQGRGGLFVPPPADEARDVAAAGEGRASLSLVSRWVSSVAPRSSACNVHV